MVSSGDSGLNEASARAQANRPCLLISISARGAERKTAFCRITFSASREFRYSELRRCDVHTADSGGRTRYGRKGSTSSGPGIACSVLESRAGSLRSKLVGWLPDHEGEYVLIKGDNIDGFYESRTKPLVGYRGSGSDRFS